MSYTTGGIGQSQTATTSNATDTLLFSYGVNNNSSGRFRLGVTARKLSNGHTKVFNLDAMFERCSGGDVNVETENISTLILSSHMVELLGVNAYVVGNGSDVEVWIKGLASTDFVWQGEINGTELYEET